MPCGGPEAARAEPKQYPHSVAVPGNYDTAATALHVLGLAPPMEWDGHASAAAFSAAPPGKAAESSP